MLFYLLIANMRMEYIKKIFKSAAGQRIVDLIPVGSARADSVIYMYRIVEVYPPVQ